MDRGRGGQHRGRGYWLLYGLVCPLTVEYNTSTSSCLQVLANYFFSLVMFWEEWKYRECCLYRRCTKPVEGEEGGRTCIIPSLFHKFVDFVTCADKDEEETDAEGAPAEQPDGVAQEKTCLEKTKDFVTCQNTASDEGAGEGDPESKSCLQKTTDFVTCKDTASDASTAAAGAAAPESKASPQ